MVAALERAVVAGDLDAATRVVEAAWFPLLRGNGDRVRELLSPVPFTQLRSHPLLAVLLGVTYYGERHRRAKALQYFAVASVAARPRNARISDAERALILAGESVGLRLFGQYSRAVGPARAALRVLDSMGGERSAVIGQLPRVYSQLGMSLYFGGCPVEALDAFSMGLAETGPHDESGFGNLAMLSGMHALDGDILVAREYVDLARGEPWTDQQRAMYTGTFYRIAEAVIALEQFDTTAAQNHLDAMIHDRGTIEHWVAIVRVEAMTALLSDAAATGLSRLESFAISRGSDGRSPSRRASLASVRALLHLALGNIDAASEILRRDAPASPQTNVDRARVSLVRDHTGAALRDLRAIAGTSQSSRTSAEASAIEAAVLLRVSSTGASRSAVDRLGALLRDTGQRSAIALLPRADLERVRSALSKRGHDALFEGVELRSVFVDTDTGSTLTPRELEVLKALERTGSTSQIASALFVSVNTVKSQVKSIYRKLGVNNREDAIAVAIARHLFIDTED
ncbi:helix-turn-helix transcriptional regulator [Agromyces ramosus]|uniref:helix-turn-helix transcriptional regulator n=1 Tax=Agromyces ramosus TaxID=33879 RepID=UPI0027D857E9|nr:LuxR family transcriptional regulator [Agromyces ramosus]